MYLFTQIIAVALTFMFAANWGARTATRELLKGDDPLWDISDSMSMTVDKKGQIYPKYPLGLPLAIAIVLIGLSPWIVGFFVNILVGVLLGPVGLALDYIPIVSPMSATFVDDIEYITIWKYGAMAIPGFYVGYSSVLGYAAKSAIRHMNLVSYVPDSSGHRTQTYVNRAYSPVHPDNDWTYKHIFLEIEKRKSDSNDA